MPVQYNHQIDPQWLEGAQAAIPYMLGTLGTHVPTSVLDVGCGIGKWLKALEDHGITHVYGIDGVDIPEGDLLVSRSKFQVVDLRTEWRLPQRYDLIICMEVAEHLEEQYAESLVRTICLHSDRAVFSAACPGQEGQNHVNCQWPQYWQAKFNKCGYSCCDEVRWKMWPCETIEPYYRQNCFIAFKDFEKAGSENRILSVIHPEMLENLMAGAVRALNRQSGQH